MRIHTWSAAAILAGASLAVPVAAAEDGTVFMYDGNTLYKICSPTDPAGQALCNAYIRGALEGMWTGPALVNARASRPAYCLPSAVAFTQVRDLVVKRLTDHPEERHLASTRIIFEAINEAFPCR